MSVHEESSASVTRLLGAIGLALVLGVSGLLVAVYLKAFADTLPVTVVADRAGLLLDKGARVRLSGVHVGEVRSTSLRDDGRVDIEVALDEDQADMVPEDVRASIRGTTIFGAKYVDLRAPTKASSTPIAAGAVVDAEAVTVEVNDVFEHGKQVMEAANPSDLNNTLASVSVALEGRGDDLGQAFVGWGDYLGKLQPHLDELESVLEVAPGVAGTYADVMPAFLQAADNVATTSESLAARQAQLHDLLESGVGYANSGVLFLTALEQPLTQLNEHLLPVTALGREYAPGLGCLIDDFHNHLEVFEHWLGSDQYDEPYLYAKTQFLPGMEKYNFEEHAPKIVTGVGPVCYPKWTPENPRMPHVDFDDGTAGIYSEDAKDQSFYASKTPFALYDDAARTWLGEDGLAGMLEGLAGGAR